MGWFDIFCVLFIVLVTYIGSKRGLVFEVFDVVILTLGTGLSLYLYNYLADFILSLLKWNKNFAKWFSFLAVFIVITGVLFFIGILLDKLIKLNVTMKSLNTFGGFVVGFLKSFILLWILLLLIMVMPFAKEGKKHIFKSFCARSVWGSSGVFTGIMEIASPTFACDYVNKVIKNSAKIIK